MQIIQEMHHTRHQGKLFACQIGVKFGQDEYEVYFGESEDSKDAAFQAAVASAEADIKNRTE